MKFTGNCIFKMDLPDRGREIATAALADFVAATPEDYLRNTTDLRNDNTVSAGIAGAWAEGGKLYLADAAWLGLAPDFEALGEAVGDYQ